MYHDFFALRRVIMLYDAEIMVFKLYCTIVIHYIDYISIHLTYSKYIRN